MESYKRTFFFLDRRLINYFSQGSDILWGLNNYLNVASKSKKKCKYKQDD